MRSCAYLGPVHTSPCLEGTSAATSPTKRDCHRASLGAGAGVARSAAGAVTPPSEPRCTPCPAGQSSLPLQRCGAGGGGERAGQPPARGQQRSGGQRLPSRACRMWPFPSKSQGLLGHFLHASRADVGADSTADRAPASRPSPAVGPGSRPSDAVPRSLPRPAWRRESTSTGDLPVKGGPFPGPISS